MRRFRVRAAHPAGLVLAGVPGLCLAQDRLLTPAGIFGDSAPLQKVVILALLLAILAAIGVAVATLRRRPGRSGAGFVSALRLGGPLLGLFGAAYSALHGFIGLANIPVTPPMRVIAPGVAESLFVLALGVLAGLVAVIAHWSVEARNARAAG